MGKFSNRAQVVYAANDLREALGIDNDDYNRWAKS